MASPLYGVSTKRRYYLLKAQTSVLFWDDLAPHWWAKQNAVVGTYLPASIPFQTKLAAAHYTRLEDLGVISTWGDGDTWASHGDTWAAFVGATEQELLKQGLSAIEAKSVLSALGV